MRQNVQPLASTHQGSFQHGLQSVARTPLFVDTKYKRRGHSQFELGCVGSMNNLRTGGSAWPALTGAMLKLLNVCYWDGTDQS